MSSLIISNGTAGRYRLNFQRSVLELIHETKWLARMGIDIPEAARILQPQETKLVKYCDILSELLLASFFELHSAYVCGPRTIDLSDEQSASKLDTLMYMLSGHGCHYKGIGAVMNLVFLWLLECNSHPLGEDRPGLATFRYN